MFISTTLKIVWFIRYCFTKSIDVIFGVYISPPIKNFRFGHNFDDGDKSVIR